ncbi:hypothetical protein [Chloroflexus sp.]|uniref:hypothetical protein n=1 Tax=Chloroflexus sp. TaxID=1904827 RepID=UPI002ADE2279|nr:hypothetical protein [Chloroflexus sp.]
MASCRAGHPDHYWILVAACGPWAGVRAAAEERARRQAKARAAAEERARRQAEARATAEEQARLVEARLRELEAELRRLRGSG